MATPESDLSKAVVEKIANMLLDELLGYLKKDDSIKNDIQNVLDEISRLGEAVRGGFEDIKGKIDRSEFEIIAWKSVLRIGNWARRMRDAKKDGNTKALNSIADDVMSARGIDEQLSIFVSAMTGGNYMFQTSGYISAMQDVAYKKLRDTADMSYCVEQYLAELDVSIKAMCDIIADGLVVWVAAETDKHEAENHRTLCVKYMNDIRARAYDCLPPILRKFKSDYGAAPKGHNPRMFRLGLQAHPGSYLVAKSDGTIVEGSLNDEMHWRKDEYGWPTSYLVPAKPRWRWDETRDPLKQTCQLYCVDDEDRRVVHGFPKIDHFELDDWVLEGRHATLTDRQNEVWFKFLPIFGQGDAFNLVGYSRRYSWEDPVPNTLGNAGRPRGMWNRAEWMIEPVDS